MGRCLPWGSMLALFLLVRSGTGCLDRGVSSALTPLPLCSSQCMALGALGGGVSLQCPPGWQAAPAPISTAFHSLLAPAPKPPGPFGDFLCLAPTRPHWHGHPAAGVQRARPVPFSCIAPREEPPHPGPMSPRCCWVRKGSSPFLLPSSAIETPPPPAGTESAGYL